MPRDYPALDLRWPTRPSDDHVERLLAVIDDEAPTAVEERADGLRVFFATPASRARAAAGLTAADPALTCTPLDVSDEDWAVRSQASLGPVRVGDIVVAPETDTGLETDAGRRIRDTRAKPTPGIGFEPGVGFRITIAPSMGFGTGHHASTRLCLGLLQRVTVSGARVLDVGTGSGVLALAAWKLGARDVVAIDYDPDALASARENLERNGATGAIRLALVDLAHLSADAEATLRPAFDVVLANLTGGALIRLAVTLAGLVAPGGRVIASGLQADETAAVARAFAHGGLSLVERADEDGWVGAVFTRRT